MKNGPFLLLGLFTALGVSFAAIVLGAHGQLGRLTPFYDDAESQAYPQRMQGVAARGQLVYADLGCAACHTQQVRRPDYGNDKARGWGERQSVARDYIHQPRPQLGGSRLGPDLANYAARKPTEEAIYNLLYAGSATHPGYRFLFQEREIVGERSAKAISPAGALAPKAGFQIVPTERAQTLAAYLLNLNNTYDYPEARPFVESNKGEEPNK